MLSVPGVETVLPDRPSRLRNTPAEPPASRRRSTTASRSHPPNMSNMVRVGAAEVYQARSADSAPSRHHETSAKSNRTHQQTPDARTPRQARRRQPECRNHLGELSNSVYRLWVAEEVLKPLRFRRLRGSHAIDQSRPKTLRSYRFGSTEFCNPA